MTENRIRDLRKAKGWTQVQLAMRSGLTGAAIGQIENGRAHPTPEKRAALASALCVAVGEAFPGNAEDEETEETE